MIKLPPPSDAHGHPYEAKSVYDLCISKVRDTSLKIRLQGIRTDIESAEALYHEKAAQTNLHLIAHTKDVGAVSKVELLSVYTRMIQEENPGRVVYDRIKIGAKGEQCPLCGFGQVKTLDHHLPQAHYTLQCVNPKNLVPACRDCQAEKSSDYPKTREAQTLHPYYDHYQNDIWLRAEVIQGTTATFRYFVDPTAPYQQLDIDRLIEHVRVFGLAGRFAVRAADELQNIRQGLQMVHRVGGAAEVRRDLEARTASSEATLKNSWRSAMYRAAAESGWFCDGGFLLT